MTDDITHGCAAFDARLADYLDHTLPAAARAEADAHLAACGRCDALVQDLRAIVRDAAALGPVEPARDLWSGIAARIETPIVPIGRSGEHAVPAGAGGRETGRETGRDPGNDVGVPHVTRLSLRDPASRRLLVSRRWLAVAASVLVVASVGATVAVMRATQGAQPGATRLVASTTPVPGSTNAMAPTSSDAPTAGVPNGSPARRPTATPDAAPFRAPTDVRAVSADADATLPAAAAYDREIASLRRALDRRSDLDSATVTVIEQNLKIIDDAVAACRRALARDPGSRLLGDQLTRTLDQKVELLRTAVLLPARS